jgi:hypothetical protein
MALEGYVACTEVRNTFKIWIGKPEGRIPLGGPEASGRITLALMLGKQIALDSSG